MANQGGEFNFFQGIHVRINIRIENLHFYKTYAHQIWQAGTSTGFDSNETNQAGTGGVITSRSLDKSIISPLTECLWPPNLSGW